MRPLVATIVFIAVATWACEREPAGVPTHFEAPRFATASWTGGLEVRIATGSQPAISGDRIVYTHWHNVNGTWTNDIYLYDLATQTEVPITNDVFAQGWPAISGDRIVWRDDRNGNPDIYLYDLSTQTEVQITTDAARQEWPAIDGDRIVWLDYRNGYGDIYLYDLAANVESRIPTSLSSKSRPLISGDRIVWGDFRNGYGDIYLYDLATQTEVQITTGFSNNRGAPAIWGDRVVWVEDLDIHLYDLSTQTESQIAAYAPVPVYQSGPRIWGDRIVWAKANYPYTGSLDIHLYDLSTQTDFQITTEASLKEDAVIWGSRIVWADYRNGPGWDIYAYGPKRDFFSCSMVTSIPIEECQALVALYNATDGDNWKVSADPTIANWLRTTELCQGPFNPDAWFGVYCFDGHVGWLDLRQINLSGPIPPELAQLTQLQRLWLSGNRLTGPIPTWLGERTSLTTLDLDFNLLTGTIPPELGNLTALQYLWLSTNQLSGSIPTEFGQLTALRHVALWQNPNLAGAVPLGFAQIVDALGKDHCFLGKSGLLVYDTPAYRAADVNGDGAICDLPLLPPPDPSGLIAAIKSRIQGLVSARVLASAKARPLLNILEDVQKHIDKGQFAAAADILLYNFIPKVQTSVASGVLSAVDGQALIDLAQRAIDLLRALV